MAGVRDELRIVRAKEAKVRICALRADAAQSLALAIHQDVIAALLAGDDESIVA